MNNDTKNSAGTVNESPKWRISELKPLASTPVFQVLTGQVHSPRTGITKDFYKLDFGSWVNIVARTPDHELLFIRQYRFGTDQLELEIPGGAVNDEEPPLEAGLRELLEETGYAGESARIIGKVCPNPALQDNHCFTVLVENVKKVAEPDLDDMEDIEVLTIPEAEAFALIESGELLHGLVLNGMMFYAISQRTAGQ